MASHFPSLQNLLKGAVAGFAFGLGISIAPFFMIEHQRGAEFILHQPLPQLAQATCLIASTTLAFAKHCSDKAQDNLPKIAAVKPLKTYAFPLLGTIFLFLFKACALLCQKLDVCPLPTNIISKENWMWLGLSMIFLALLITVGTVFADQHVHATTIRTQSNPLLVEHPIYTSTLLYLLGLTLSFTTWFPLLAIPGAFVSLIWYIRVKESATVGNVRNNWRILPYLY